MSGHCAIAIRHIIIGRVLIIYYTLYIIHYTIAKLQRVCLQVFIVIIVIRCTCGCSYSALKSNCYFIAFGIYLYFMKRYTFPVICIEVQRMKIECMCTCHCLKTMSDTNFASGTTGNYV